MQSIRKICVIALLFSSLSMVAFASATPTSKAKGHSGLSHAHTVGDVQLQPPTFATTVVYGATGFLTQSAAIGDVNGDGKPDMVVANLCATPNENCTSDGSLDVRIGNGDGTFQAPVTYPSGGSQAITVAIADVNGDGKPDLIVDNLCSSGDSQCRNFTAGVVGVLLGNGDGTFQAPEVYRSGSLAGDLTIGGSLAVADVNGDGKPDIIVADVCQDESCSVFGAVGVLLGNGDGTFQNVVLSSSGGYYAVSIAVRDVNSDGKPDVLVANGFDPVTSDGSVGVLIGNGDGTFQTPVTYDSGVQNASSMAVADLNGDGKPDVVISDDGAFSVLLGNGDGTFQTADTSVHGDEFGPIAAGDVNGDGKTDIVFGVQCGICQGTLQVFLGNGDGTLQPEPNMIPAGGFETESIALADLNGDGKIDIVAANADSYKQCFCAGAVGVLINTTAEGTTTSLVSSVNPSVIGQSVTFTATVTGQISGTLTGTVTFLDGTTSLGSPVTISGGVAVFSTSTLALGTHSITAAYSGDGTFAPSTSPVVNQVVQTMPQGFTLAAGSQSSQTVPPGQTATYAVTLTPANGFNQTVALTCSGEPAKSTCTITPDSVTLDGTNSATASVTVSTTASTSSAIIPAGSSENPDLAASRAWTRTGAMGIALMIGGFGSLRKPRRSALLRTVAIACLIPLGLALPGCGGGGSSSSTTGTAPGTYTVTVTGTTMGSTKVTQQVQFTLIVQ